MRVNSDSASLPGRQRGVGLGVGTGGGGGGGVGGGGGLGCGSSPVRKLTLQVPEGARLIQSPGITRQYSGWAHTHTLMHAHAYK